MKLNKIRFGEKIDVFNGAELMAWIISLPTVLAFLWSLEQFIRTNETQTILLIAAFAGALAVVFFERWSKTFPKSQYVITRILAVDETGTKALRVQVRYRDGSLEEMNFAK